MKKIKTILISGFLGAGKTTCLNYMLGQAPFNGSRTAVLVNDFGKLSVDAMLIGDDCPLEAINGGSIFCACVQGSLVESLERISALPQIDYLLIEATGLAEPRDFYQLMQLKHLSDIFVKQAVVAVADALNFHKLCNIMNSFTAQIAIADIVLVNKCDIAPAQLVEDAEDKIREINRKAQIIRCENSVFDVERIFSMPIAEAKATLAGLCKKPPENICELNFESDRCFNLDSFIGKLQNKSAHLLRAKGVIKLKNSSIKFIEAVNGEISVGSVPERSKFSSDKTRICFILQDISTDEFLDYLV